MEKPLDVGEGKAVGGRTNKRKKGIGEEKGINESIEAPRGLRNGC